MNEAEITAQVSSHPSIERDPTGEWERVLWEWVHRRRRWHVEFEPPVDYGVPVVFRASGDLAGGRTPYWSVSFQPYGSDECHGHVSGYASAEDAFRGACRVAYEIERQWVEENVVVGLA